jgi:hypothetical protein
MIESAIRKEISRFGQAIALVESVSRRVKLAKKLEGY